jgi:penicillin-binding protein 2
VVSLRLAVPTMAELMLEATTFLKPKAWLSKPMAKLAATGEAWQQGETLITGIGQGSVLATPLQIATMAARLVTGRQIVPHLVRDGKLPPGGDRRSPNFGAMGISPHAIGVVLDGMTAVVNEQGGTAYNSRIKDPAFAMGGKSGTSQVRHITEYERDHGLTKADDVPWKDREHALFVAFAPVGAPRYACAVIVEHGGVEGGGGSEVAAPIVRDVLLEVQKRDPARHVPQPDSVAQAAAPVPLPLPENGGRIPPG